MSFVTLKKLPDFGQTSDKNTTVPEKLPLIRFVLVEPMYKGNIGSTARVMKNFGFTDLVLVNPCSFSGETWAMASHASDVVENAVICSTLKEAVEGCDIIVGTTGARAYRKCDHVRTPALTPKKLMSHIRTFGQHNKTAVLFGRENCGFTNEELQMCTIISTIPTSDMYPVMNLSHAVGVMAYELSHSFFEEYEKDGDLPVYRETHPIVDRKKFEYMCDHIRNILEESDYTPEKLDRTMLMFRRVLGRAELTPCESQTIRGVLRHLQYHVKKSKGLDVTKKVNSVLNIFDEDEFKL